VTELCRLSIEDDASAVIAALELDGAVVIEKFLGPESLAGLRRDLLPPLAQRATGNGFAGDRTRRLSALFAHTRHMVEIVTHPLYYAAAEHFICKPYELWGGDQRRSMAADLRIGVTQAIQIGPGQAAQPLHRDDTVFFWRHPSEREGRVQIMCALSDFTRENGGTLAIPGSHLWDDERKPEMSEAIATVMPAGSALIWLGSTYHGGGANVTEAEYRTGVGLALDAANMRQEENMYLALNRDVVASYPEKVQRLLGWSSGANHMGWIEVDGQMTDPIHLLREVATSTLG
jgi:ectoine hydroxylase-related dioxygenase (phytanoyl-CoA dioxygenase family)